MKCMLMVMLGSRDERKDVYERVCVYQARTALVLTAEPPKSFFLAFAFV